MLVQTASGQWLEYSADPNSPWRQQQFDPSPADPFEVLAPHLVRPPRWLVLGGLGDIDDVGPALRRWPQVKVVGIDPDPKAIAWQTQHLWPEGAPLLKMALAHRPGMEAMHLSSVCCSSLHEENVQAAPEDEINFVHVTTLDVLDRQLGPFEDVVLWLDCEGYDFRALKGGQNLLLSGRVLAVNFEVWYRDPVARTAAYELLTFCGFARHATWFRQWWGHNEIWIMV